MIKILHTADWHLDAPLRQFSEAQRRTLRSEMLHLPGKIADVCIREGCDLCLIAGDVFDSHQYTRQSYEAVYAALERMGVPVVIAPGNHDFYWEQSPWFQEKWPVNVHIFKTADIRSIRIANLDCRVYGAAFTGPESPALLTGFHAGCTERYALMVVHGDPTAADSIYNPVTAAQIREAGLDYAALGHIHAAGRFGAGAGMCAWPGCPMGHGYDETGVKGVLVVEQGEATSIRFLPLDVPKFYDLAVAAGMDPAGAILSALPAGGSSDFFRVRLTGETACDVQGFLAGRFSDYPNLTILDETAPAVDLWERAGEDTLEGLYFQILQNARDGQDSRTVEILELAARISRQILDGREVELP